MKTDVIRHNRIMDIYRKALTGKYTWTQLYQMAESMGVSKSTAKSYIDAVHQRLREARYIK